MQGVETAAIALGVKLLLLEVRLPTDLESAFQKATEHRLGLVIAIQDSMFFAERKRIAALARVPVMYGFREHVLEGGLISYGFSVRDNWRRAAGYVAKIFSGDLPGELPVELPTKLEMAINLQTAKNYGVTVPPSLLVRADEVIE